ncbi:cell envelope biogenesis protein OmpA [Agarivorans sp. Toyoura001]|uniref:flagellar motor protein MotB n=1 Tax=Agarivorans sp. Toyoura001 TaxID=2283141 RepID=UPI0010D24AAA|nr:flagellar motor protein MotB [Agarivorans sp. Toyoura001]GDY24184.1 cell envelope biogenesis protein OmpA [Agarivorans sp. Toyoura001]
MRRRYAVHAKPKASSERWLVSYADYMTLMFALFVVLYAMAIANENEYPELQQRLQQAIALFEESDSAILPIESNSAANNEEGILFSGQSILDGISPAKKTPVHFSENDRNPALDEFSELAEQLVYEFKDFLKSDDIVISYDEQWLTIELDSRLFFASGSAYLLKPATQVIDQLADRLKHIDNFIRVRGYTDETSIDSELYPSNWELSAARATRVLRELQSRGVTPARMAIEAFAEYAPEGLAQGNRQNRRVVIALSSKVWEPPVVAKQIDVPAGEELEKPLRKPDSDTMLAVPIEGGGVRFTTRQEE